MEKDRAIPNGYMTVGRLAKKMNTTVRTLQYYDREGLLSPSAESVGGRRLYTNKDVIRLHQIQSMKFLGFSLDNIKKQLVSFETPAQVAASLEEQARDIKEKIANLSEVLQSIDKLQTEILQMKTVDWEKYADIVVNLQMKNEFYGLIKHFDKNTLEHLHSRFDMESATAMINMMKHLTEEMKKLQKNGIPPESGQGQALAKAWWEMVMDFTNGDMSLLSNLIELAGTNEDDDWNKIWQDIEGYLQKTLDAYFANLGHNPFEGVTQ